MNEKKETLVQVFSCEFCEIFKSIFFTEHLLLKWVYSTFAESLTCYKNAIWMLFKWYVQVQDSKHNPIGVMFYLCDKWFIIPKATENDGNHGKKPNSMYSSLRYVFKVIHNWNDVFQIIMYLNNTSHMQGMIHLNRLYNNYIWIFNHPLVMGLNEEPDVID